MAFRKTIKSFSRPSFQAHGFCERKFADLSATDSSVIQTLKDVPVEDLADTALPLVSLRSLLKTGQTIKGDVSFAPSDVADLETSAAVAILSHAQRIESSKSDSSESQSVSE